MLPKQTDNCRVMMTRDGYQEPPPVKYQVWSIDICLCVNQVNNDNKETAVNSGHSSLS